MKWFTTGVKNTDEPFIKRVSVSGHTICLVGYEGHIYALANKCPHAGEELSRGWCTDEKKIVCPYHRFSYSLETGRGSPGQNDYVNTYSVKIEADEIYVGFETFKEKLKALFQ